MTRRPRHFAAMEGRSSIAVSQGSAEPTESARSEVVRFVSLERARALIVLNSQDVSKLQSAEGCIVWVYCRPGCDTASLEARLYGELDAAAVRFVVDGAEDALIPADVQAPPEASEVRPVVAELVAELGDDVRDVAAQCVERHLSAQGL